MAKLDANVRRAIETELRQYSIVDGYIVRVQKGRDMTKYEKKRAALLHKFYLNNDYLVQEILELRYLGEKKTGWKEVQLEVGYRYRPLLEFRDRILTYLMEWFQKEKCWKDIAPK